MDRRHFLALASATAAAGALGRSSASLAATPDFKALVCVFLYGGNDSFNMVAPRSDAQYADYATARQNLALAQASLLPISAATPDGALYGLHPAMTALQSRFAAGRLAVLANTGPLVQPVTKAQVLAGSVELPPQLFSHIDQQLQWQTLRGTGNTATGWAGRAADLLASTLAGQALPVNISISGTVPLQAAATTAAYAVGDQGPVSEFVLDPAVYNGAIRRNAVLALLGSQAATPYGRALQQVRQRALAYGELTSVALAAAPALATAFPAGTLGNQLAMVARLVSARLALGMQRQLFVVGVGGFDTHDGQLTAQPQLLGGLSDALAAFDAAMVELGVDRQVTAFTLSDFGRTLTSNGDGTDHGWGGHQLVLGGAVRGGDIYGTMPSLALGGPDDVDAGRMVPTTSAQEYAATLLRWFGLAESGIDQVIPDLGRFARRDLGFMAA